MLASPVMATPKESSPAWYTIPATDNYQEVTYAQLNSIEIGGVVYTGVACNLYDETFTWSTFTLRQLHTSTHYFGELGEMNHGFRGTVTVFLQYTSLTTFYVVANWALEGFGLNFLFFFSLLIFLVELYM